MLVNSKAPFAMVIISEEAYLVTVLVILYEEFSISFSLGSIHQLSTDVNPCRFRNTTWRCLPPSYHISGCIALWTLLLLILVDLAAEKLCENACL